MKALENLFIAKNPMQKQKDFETELAKAIPASLEEIDLGEDDEYLDDLRALAKQKK